MTANQWRPPPPPRRVVVNSVSNRSSTPVCGPIGSGYVRSRAPASVPSGTGTYRSGRQRKYICGLRMNYETRCGIDRTCVIRRARGSWVPVEDVMHRRLMRLETKNNARYAVLPAVQVLGGRMARGLVACGRIPVWTYHRVVNVSTLVGFEFSGPYHRVRLNILPLRDR